MAYKNVLIFGAGGPNIGPHILHALVQDGAFHVSVLARKSSKTIHPSTVKVVKIPDSVPHKELVEAFTGQDVVIAVTGFPAHDVQYKLIDAAIEARVKRYFPSEWGFDNEDPNCYERSPVFAGKNELTKYLRNKESETFSWTAVATSIWLEWALDCAFIDINPNAHTVQYWRDGTFAFSHTTLAYAAPGVVQILKRPEIAQNKRIFMSAFEASQRDVVAELEKQQGVKYTASNHDVETTVAEARAQWDSEKDINAAYRLVVAGILLPEAHANFTSAGKRPILEEIVKMPKLTLEGVVQEWLAKSSEEVKSVSG